MVFVSVARVNGRSVITPSGVTYVRMLANALNGYGLSEWLGRDAPFNNNRRAMDEGIHHCHIRLMGIDEPWHREKRQYSRTSDNFLIYAKHWQYSNYCQILGIISPNAHAEIDGYLPAFCDFTEKNFSPLSEHQLRQLQSISS